MQASTVVGYTQTAMRNGFAGTALNFVNVSGTASKLGDLVVKGYDPEEGYAETDILISKVNDHGSELDGMFYNWFDFYNEEVGEQWYGWYDQDGNCWNDLDLSIGEGVMVQAPDAWVKIEVAGQVYDDTLPIQLRNGFTLVGNACPMALKLGQIEIDGYDPNEGYAETDILVSQLNDHGSELNGMFYNWFDFYNEEVGEQWYGWYDQDGKCWNSLDIAVGEALMIQAPGTWAYVNFPKPF